MRKQSKSRFLPLLLIPVLVFLLPAPIPSFAAQPTVNLGTTSTYAVLAGSGITNTGTTVINGDAGGDIGSSPTGTFTGQASVTSSGAIHLADAAADLAKTDLIIAYDDAAGRLPVTRIPSELGGTTLTPGVYDSADGTFQITGTLTLDAQGDPDGVFVFKTASTLTTASNSNVSLINSARYCRTFWQVGSSATLGTNSHFVGHIFALTSITATTGATVQGQLLARNGAVTLDNNTITNGVCAVVPTLATLNVIKHVINDNGGSSTAANFNLHVKSGGLDVATSPAAGAESPGKAYSLAAGTYTLSEDPVAGYISVISGDSDAGGNITLVAGDNKTITITNNDIPVPVPPYTGGGGNYYIQPPLISVTKIPSPLALISGTGEVTYTYKITNPSNVELSNISIKDDKITTINYISGDTNSDSKLQSSETWLYRAVATLKSTTTNAVTVQGTGNGITVIDVATATVVVSNSPAEIVYPPIINVVKIPNPLALIAGPGTVVYTYTVTNPGVVPLSNVALTDNKVRLVSYVSGDVNGDKLLQPSETWVYKSKSKLNQTVTNTVTAKGEANGMTATDIAIATVIVTQPTITPPTVTHTITGGTLPATATPWYNLLFGGALFMLLGAAGWKGSRKL